MALPVGVETVTVSSGQPLTLPDGTPMVGFLVFTGPALVTIQGEDVILGGDVRVPLVDGEFSVTLVATDATGMDPTGWAYRVKAVLNNSTGWTRYISLPKADDSVVLADVLITDPDVPAYESLLSQSEADARYVLNSGDDMTGVLVVRDVDGTPTTYPVGRTGTIGTTGIDILSSFDGGEDDGTGTDSTGRLNLYSYQRAQTGSFGENVRHFLMRRDAKSMDAWYFPVTTDGQLASGYDGTSRDPLASGIKWTPGAWTGAHWEANDHASLHMHWELEIPDATGALQGRIVVPFGNTATGKLGLDKTNIGINQADLTMHASTGGILRLAGSTSYNKDIEFSLDSEGGTSYRRWKIRGADATAESGNNVGSNFAIFRYDDSGTINSTPSVKILRNNGNVGINKSTPTAALDVTGTFAVTGNSLGQYKPYDQGMVAWAYDPAMIVNSHQTTSGNIYLVKQVVASDASVTKIQYYVSVVASSVTSGQNFAGIYSSSGTLLGSVDISSDITSTGLKTATISSQALTAGSFVWVALVFNASTAPSLGRTGGLANIATVVNANLLASQYRFGLITGSNTSLPSSITPSSNSAGNPIWAAIA